jgi:hypothetical protein
MERAMRTNPHSPARPRLTPGESRAIEEANFLREHPEMAHYVGLLLSTVAACEDSNMTLAHMPLEGAFQHVLGACKCKWCEETFVTKKKRQEELYSAAN